MTQPLGDIGDPEQDDPEPDYADIVEQRAEEAEQSRLGYLDIARYHYSDIGLPSMHGAARPSGVGSTTTARAHSEAATIAALNDECRDLRTRFEASQALANAAVACAKRTRRSPTEKAVLAAVVAERTALKELRQVTAATPWADHKQLHNRWLDAREAVWSAANRYVLATPEHTHTHDGVRRDKAIHPREVG